MRKTRLQLLSTLYLAVLCVSLPLLWCTSLSMRVEFARVAPRSTSRRVLLLRVLSKHAARELGTTVIWFMVVPAALGGALGHSVLAAAFGAPGGLAAMALFPVMLPMPSREIADAAATDLRYF